MVGYGLMTGLSVAYEEGPNGNIVNRSITGSYFSISSRGLEFTGKIPRSLSSFFLYRLPQCGLATASSLPVGTVSGGFTTG
ncbi:hypothetical protein GCM10027180_08170 [Microbulbifer echini]